MAAIRVQQQGQQPAQQQVIVRMPTELHDAIKQRAAEEERSMAQAIRHAVRLYLSART